MKEVALHVLDIAENGTTAGAGIIRISIDEARMNDRLEIIVQDDGNGILPEKLVQVTDPFVTTRTTRRVGLGLSLLEAAARRCGGRMTIESGAGEGTRVTAVFQYNHIDRAPMGDMAGTLTTLIAGHPDVDFIYTHRVDGDDFTLDTREIRKEAGTGSLEGPRVIHILKDLIDRSLGQLRNRSRGNPDAETDH